MKKGRSNLHHPTVSRPSVNQLTMERRTEGSRLWTQWLLTAASIGGLVVAGEPGGAHLTLPPLNHPAHVLAWWSSSGPELGSMSILRLTGLLVGGYWLLLCTTAIVARSCDRVVWLTRLRLPGTSRLIRSAAGASLLGAALLAAGGCGHGGADRIGGGHAPAPPVLVPVAGAAELAPVTVAPAPAPVTDEAAPAPATTLPARSLPQPPAATAPPAGTPAGTSSVPATATGAATTPTRWTVKPGDDLWSISESVLATRLGHRPDERAVASLWLQVIDANRATLADPGNPNLIFAGEVVLVPG